MPLIETKIEGSVGTICLDYFEKSNALSAALVDDILNALATFAEERVRAIVLRARPGVKIWSAGHDVDELPGARRDPLGWYDPLRRLIRAIGAHPAPIIAMIEGGVWGGACEMAMAFDIIVTAENAMFALTPAKLGVPYNVSGMLPSSTAPRCASSRRWPSPHGRSRPSERSRRGSSTISCRPTNSRPSPTPWPRTSSPTRRYRSQ
jgi:methylmalonyl-CoA decarboxylase